MRRYFCRWCCRKPIRRPCSWWPARSLPVRRIPMRRNCPRAAFRFRPACGVETPVRGVCGGSMNYLSPRAGRGRPREARRVRGPLRESERAGHAPSSRPSPRKRGEGARLWLRAACSAPNAAITQPRRHRVDTRRGRPRLGAFRGERWQALRDRVSGDPLNLIRVMPAKGRKLLPNSALTPSVRNLILRRPRSGRLEG